MTTCGTPEPLIKLTFIGAAHEVTGSCFLVETDGRRFLVDCGMFQGA
jgi:metallo-beta-lactamase family protein